MHKFAVLLLRNVGLLIVTRRDAGAQKAKGQLFHHFVTTSKLLRKCFIGNLLLSGLVLTVTGLSCDILVWAGYGVQRKLSRVIVIGGDMESYFPAVPCNSLGVV